MSANQTDAADVPSSSSSPMPFFLADICPDPFLVSLKAFVCFFPPHLDVALPTLPPLPSTLFYKDVFTIKKKSNKITVMCNVMFE